MSENIIDSNINLEEESNTAIQQNEVKEQKKILNFHLSKIIESLLVWIAKKNDIKEEDIENEIKLDIADKDLLDDALNPLISKIIEILGLENTEVFALFAVSTVLIPRIAFILMHKPKKEIKKEIKQIKEERENEQNSEKTVG
ncbi:MAG: hypothetical protein QXV17_07290 [Candidatus Micrarchaeaceae archaeon]